VLTPLQQQIASIVGNLPEAQQFPLADGAALIARGDVDRLTRDLDFFGPSAIAVDQLIPVIEHAFREAGMTVKRIREGSGFYRLEVSQADEITEVISGSTSVSFRLSKVLSVRHCRARSLQSSKCSPCSGERKPATL